MDSNVATDRVSTPPRWEMAALVAITLLAALLRWFALGESLWIDELHTSWSIQSSLRDVFSRAALGNQGPVYYVALWCWVALCGESELTLRLPSFIAGLALPAAVYWSARRLAGETTPRGELPLFAAFLAATDQFAIFYAQEARPYAWVMLGSVWHFTTFVAWREQPTRGRAVGLVVGMLLLFYTHYTTALLFLAEFVWAVCGLWRRDRPLQFQLRDLLLLPLLVALICGPAMRHLRDIASRRGNWEAFVGIPEPAELLTMFPAAWGVLGLILMLAIVMGRPLVRRLFRRRSVPATWFSSATLSLGMSAAVWLFVPLLAAWLATRFDIARIFFPRYLLMSLPASWLLLVHATRLAPEWRSRWIFSAVIACGWVAYQLPHYQELFPSDRSSGPRGEDWRGAIAWLNEQLPEQPGPVLLAPGLIEERNLSLKSSPEWQEYCQFPVRALYRLDVPVEECLRDEKDSFPHMNVTLKLAPSSFYWQVERDDVAWDVRYQRIAGYVDSSSWRSVHWVERRSFGKVTVSRWKVTEYKGTAR